MLTRDFAVVGLDERDAEPFVLGVRGSELAAVALAEAIDGEHGVLGQEGPSANELGRRSVIVVPQGSRQELPTRHVFDVARALRAGKSLTVFVPTAMLAAARDAAFREGLGAELGVELVVDIGEGLGETVGVSDFGASQRLAMIRGRKGGEAVTRFFVMPQRGGRDVKHVVADLRRLCELSGGFTEFGFVHRGVLDASVSWAPSYYRAEAVGHRHEMLAVTSLSPLCEVAGVVPSIPREELDQEVAGKGPRAAILQAREMTESGVIAPLEQRLEAAVREESVLVPGDVCVRAVLRAGSSSLVTAVFPENEPPTMAAESVIVVRPREGAHRVDAPALVAFLSSPRACRLLRERGVTVRITARDLETLPVPIPKGPAKLVLDDLDRARRYLADWLAELDRIQAGLLEADSYANAVSRLFGSGQRLRERVAAGRRVDELAYRVRTQFPHPLAFLWRGVEASEADMEGYVRVLECGEAIACFLAAVSIVNARAMSFELASVAALAEKLGGSRGTTFGDWTEILREGRGKRFKAAVTSQTPVPEVIESIGNDAEAALHRLKHRRDDQAHGRGPRGHTLEREYGEARTDLELLVSACDFLTQYPFRFVEETRWDSISQHGDTYYRDLGGDQALVPREQIQVASVLEAGSLYLVDRADHFHLLRPMLSWLPCDVCGREATFFLDRYYADNQMVILKSLEHGHTIERPDLAEPLRSLGLLAGHDNGR